VGPIPLPAAILPILEISGCFSSPLSRQQFYADVPYPNSLGDHLPTIFGSFLSLLWFRPQKCRALRCSIRPVLAGAQMLLPRDPFPPFSTCRPSSPLLVTSFFSFLLLWSFVRLLEGSEPSLPFLAFLMPVYQRSSFFSSATLFRSTKRLPLPSLFFSPSPYADLFFCWRSCSRPVAPLSSMLPALPPEPSFGAGLLYLRCFLFF